MNKFPKDKASVYVLNENHMQKLDELITELHCVYCDIYSNRELSTTSGLRETPTSALINALIENNVAKDHVI